jgi:hypothetical protein
MVCPAWSCPASSATGEQAAKDAVVDHFLYIHGAKDKLGTVYRRKAGARGT